MFKRISTTLLAIMFLTLLNPIVAPQTLEDGEAASTKVTICHRTASIKNPYRKITVSKSAVNRARGHNTHNDPIWTTSNVQGDRWGDIIPDATAGGTNAIDLNFSAAGEAIWRGQTLNPATGSAVCKGMSIKQFRDSEIEAGRTPAQIIEDLNDTQADEDLALLRSLGLTFSSLDTLDELNSLVAASEAIVVTTLAATSVTTTGATLNGSVKTDGTALTCHFEYSANSGFDPSTFNPVTATSVPIDATTARTVNIIGLTSGTKYFYRHVCHDSIDGDLYGETLFFTAGTNYTITYDSNTALSGTVPNDLSLYTSTESAIVRGNEGGLSKTGYSFAGWTLDQNGTGTVYSPTQTDKQVVMSSNRVLYAKWSANTFPVIFDSNTATSGSMANQTFTAGSALGLSSIAFAKTGFTFAGWATTSVGSVAYTDGQSLTLYETTTVYAKWTAQSFNVTFDSNTAESGSMSAQSFTAGTSQALNSENFTKTGFTFSGWATSSGGSVVYANQASITINADLTLYAKWVAISNFPISFDSNTATSGSMSDQTFTAGTGQALTANGFTKSGHTFAGWATSSSGPVVYTNSQNVTLYEAATVYAKWTAGTFSLTFDSNTATSGSMSNQSFTADVSQAISSNGYSRSGHAFAGWATTSGGSVVYANGASLTINADTTIYAKWLAAYAVTFTLNSGTGTAPTESDKASGVSVVLPSGSGFSRGGFTFAGWSCNSSSTQSAGTSFTMPAEALTCVAQWTANPPSGGGGGGGGNPSATPANTSNPAAIRKRANVSLVTVATTPVKSTVVVVPNAPSTPGNSGNTPSTPSTPSTPGNSGNTPSTTGNSGNAPSTPGNSGSTPSSPGNSGSTPSSPGNSGNAPSTPGNSGNTPSTPGNNSGAGSADPINVGNTPLSQTTVIPTTGIKAITFSGAGVSRVAVVNQEVSVQARTGFSGKTTVEITLTSDEEITSITAEVLVLPLPVNNPVVRVVSDSRTRIQWLRSPNATGYEVVQNGRVLCTTVSVVNCVLPERINNNAPVEIKALGRDETESVVRQATFTATPAAPAVPEVALVVNFDTARFNIDAEDRRLIRAFAADVMRFGYTRIDISGHTDSRGGIDNNVLSNNRARAARDYLLTLVPSLRVTIGGFADSINVASNATTSGLAANRRAEFRVIS